MCMATSSRALDPLQASPTPANMSNQLDPLHIRNHKWGDPVGLLDKNQNAVDKTSLNIRHNSSGLQVTKG